MHVSEVDGLNGLMGRDTKETSGIVELGAVFLPHNAR